MKRFSIGLVAILMAIGFTAFTKPQKPLLKVFTYTYRYTGTTVGGENNPVNYTLSNNADGCLDEEDEMICQLQSNYAPDGSNHPQFPTTSGYAVRSDITNNGISKWVQEP